jgi:hypothetical protein
LEDKIRIAENFDNPLPDDVAGELEKGGGSLSLKPHKVRLLLDTQIALSVTTSALSTKARLAKPPQSWAAPYQRGRLPIAWPHAATSRSLAQQSS